MAAYKDEHEAFLQPQQDRSGSPAKQPGILRRLWPYLRLLVEVVMVLCIFVLTSTLARSETTNGESADSLRKSPIPKCKQVLSHRHLNMQLIVLPVPRKLYTFNGDERYLNENMFNSEAETVHTLHQWIPLSSGKADPDSQLQWRS
jgi:hypothetical protein